MKIGRGALPWIIGATALAIALALAFGILRGELFVPARGFGVTIQRATNPAGFCATAALYATLAGLCVWLLVAVLRAGNEVTPRTRGATRTSRAAPVGFPGTIEFAQSGRDGAVVVALASGRHEFYWEFGGGDCVAIVSVPNARQWATHPALAPHPRDAFLEALAREVGARQCPSARFEITPDAIVFRQ